MQNSMRLASALSCLVSLAFAGSLSARADVTLPPVGSVDRLVYDGLELNRLVQQSWLRPDIKQTSQGYAGNVSDLMTCARANAGLSSCGSSLQIVQANWLKVERRLNSTMYDYQSIYQQYVDARRSLYGLQGAPAVNSTAVSVQGTVDGIPYYFVDPDTNGLVESCTEFLAVNQMGSVQTINIGGNTVQTGQFSVGASQACQIIGQSGTRP
jgi:hypothetical protein